MPTVKRINDQRILWEVIRANPEVIYERNQPSLWDKYQAACTKAGVGQPTWNGFTFLWGRYIGPWEKALKEGKEWEPPKRKKPKKGGRK